MNKASLFRGNYGSGVIELGRSRAQIAEAVKIRQELAKAEISGAIRQFGAVASRRFLRMPRVCVVSDEERERAWGKNAALDQGDFRDPDRIRLSEKSSRNTAFHEAVHYIRRYSKLEQDGAMPHFTRRAISEMCAIFVAAAMSGHGIQSNPMDQALIVYNLEPGGKDLGDLNKACNYFFFMQVRALLDANGEKEAFDFFLGAGQDSIELARYDKGARAVSEYAFGRALGVIHMAHNDFSITKTLGEMLTINYDGLLKVIVGQKVKPEANEFLDLVESRLSKSCLQNATGKSSGRSTPLKAGDFSANLVDMTGSVTNAYYHILRNYHHDKRNIAQGFFSIPTARFRLR